MKKDFLNIIFVIIAIIIIVALAFLLYVFSAKEVSLNNSSVASVSGVINYERSKIIIFEPSEVLPEQTKKGNCWTNSIAQPYRKDAWRCMVNNEIYDPCFETLTENIIFCQINPLIPSAFLIELEKPLPEPSIPSEIPNNWAWFVKLKDGAYCSPFTGTRPIFEIEGSMQAAYYGCILNNKEEQIVLLGDLENNNVWTAKKAIIAKEDEKWVVKSVENIQVDVIWK